MVVKHSRGSLVGGATKSPAPREWDADFARVLLACRRRTSSATFLVWQRCCSHLILALCSIGELDGFFEKSNHPRSLLLDKDMILKSDAVKSAGGRNDACRHRFDLRFYVGASGNMSQWEG